MLGESVERFDQKVGCCSVFTISNAAKRLVTYSGFCELCNILIDGLFCADLNDGVLLAMIVFPLSLARDPRKRTER
jgi:hypothetical protein